MLIKSLIKLKTHENNHSLYILLDTKEHKPQRGRGLIEFEKPFNKNAT